MPCTPKEWNRGFGNVIVAGFIHDLEIGGLNRISVSMKILRASLDEIGIPHYGPCLIISKAMYQNARQEHADYLF